MQTTLTLSASNLCIERSEKLLCDDLSFRVRAGEILHITGENGAGKSSILKVIAGILQPLSGDLDFSGEDISLYRDVLQAELLFLGHSTGVKNVLTVFENLQLYFPKATDTEINNALMAVNLEGYLVTEAHQLSAGQKKRIALAKLWLTDKKVWLLDEPFSALDTRGIKVLEYKLKEHVECGGLILLTTHQKPSSVLDVKELHLSL